MQLTDLQPEGVGHLFLGCGSSESLFDFGVRLFEFATLLAHAARDPIHRSQLIQNGTLDSKFRVGLELAVLVRVVLLDGIHQADDTRAVEVV